MQCNAFSRYIMELYMLPIIACLQGNTTDLRYTWLLGLVGNTLPTIISCYMCRPSKNTWYFTFTVSRGLNIKCEFFFIHQMKTILIPVFKKTNAIGCAVSTCLHLTEYITLVYWVSCCNSLWFLPLEVLLSEKFTAA